MAIALAATAVTDADACKVITSQPIALADAGAGKDSEPPELKAVELTTVTRGKGPRCAEGGGKASSSCDDTGRLGLTPSASDDQTDEAALRYSVQVRSGELPEGLTVPSGALGLVNGQLSFAWPDGATDAQEPLAFSLDVRAIDLAGNESAVLSVSVESDGVRQSRACEAGDGPSCSAISSRRDAKGVGQWGALLLVGLALFRKKRLS